MADAAGAHPQPPLWLAARRGEIDNLKHCLEQEMDINERGGPRQSSPLYEAALANQEEVVKLLLKRGADVDSRDHQYNLHHMAVMHWIIYRNVLSMLCIFLEEGVDPSPRERRGWTPLHFTADNRVTGCAQMLLLLEKGADVDAQTDLGTTVLHRAVENASATMVRLLIYKGADVELETNDGQTAEDIATANGNVQIAVKLRAEAERLRVRRVAFAMGLHDRLGAGSIVQRLDPGVLRIVLQRR